MKSISIINIPIIKITTQVMWKRLYNSYSVCERSTLYQLRNILNHTNVRPNPKDNVNAAQNFIDIITTCHILAATFELFNMTDLQGVPQNDDVDLDEKTWMLPNEGRYSHWYVTKLSIHTQISSLIGSVHLNHLWTACMIYQYYFTLSPRQSHQLIWSRFVNTHGQPGHNIECDLTLRLCKNAIKGMGVNKIEKAIQHAAKAIGETSIILIASVNSHQHQTSTHLHMHLRIEI